jgi:hypothetical protein
VLWRVVVSGSDASRLGESGIVVESAFEPGAPDGSTRPTLPAWMPREATAWRMRSVYLIPVGPLLPPPALIGGVQ